MIFTDRRVNASGPRDAKIAAIGMSPQKWELSDGIPFTGPSGRIFNDAMLSAKMHRSSVYVTNLCNFFVDDNNLYSVPKDLMELQRERVYRELETVKPNILLVMGADTLDLFTAAELYENPKTHELDTRGSKNGITKWRGSLFELTTPRGYKQKCLAAMHPANFIRGQWKWLPFFKYIDVPRAVTQSLSPELKLTARTALVAPSFQTAKDYLTEAMTKEWVSIDYEGRKHISCLGLGWSPSEAMCIPLSRVGNPCYWQTVQEEAEIWRLWSALLQNAKVRKIAQNAAYEWIKSWQMGIYPSPLGMDTMHMHHCLYPDFGGINDEWSAQKRKTDNPGHGLALITSQYTDQPFYKDDGRHWTPALGETTYWRYNCLDVMVTFEAAMKMKTELERSGLWATYQREYVDYFENALRREWQGIAFDTARRDVVRAEMIADLARLGSELKAQTGYAKIITKSEKKGKAVPAGVLNLASPKQMQHFLYVERKHKPRLKRGTGKVTVDRDALDALAVKDPIIQHIIKMRQIQDLINDIIDARLDDAGRIHCHNKIGGTNGTRDSSSESILDSGTNLQNVPVQGVARSLFLPT